MFTLLYFHRLRRFQRVQPAGDLGFTAVQQCFAKLYEAGSVCAVKRLHSQKLPPFGGLGLRVSVPFVAPGFRVQGLAALRLTPQTDALPAARNLRTYSFGVQCAIAKNAGSSNCQTTILQTPAFLKAFSLEALILPIEGNRGKTNQGSTLT